MARYARGFYHYHPAPGCQVIAVAFVTGLIVGITGTILVAIGLIMWRA